MIRLKWVTLLFVSSEEPEKLNAFALKHQLNQYPNIRFLQSKQDEFDKIFKTSAIPAVVIYDKNGSLIVKIDDVVGIKTVIKYLRAANDSPLDGL